MSLPNDIHPNESNRLERLLVSIDPEVARVLDRALNGFELDFDDGLRLAGTNGLEHRCR